MPCPMGSVTPQGYGPWYLLWSDIHTHAPWTFSLILHVSLDVKSCWINLVCYCVLSFTFIPFMFLGCRPTCLEVNIIGLLPSRFWLIEDISCTNLRMYSVKSANHHLTTSNAPPVGHSVRYRVQQKSVTTHTDQRSGWWITTLMAPKT